MSDKYVVVRAIFNDKDVMDFIQVIGTYNDLRTAYGVAYLELCDSCKKYDGVYNEEMKVSVPFRLEMDTGYGMEVKHDGYTETCFILERGSKEAFADEEDDTKV